MEKSNNGTGAVKDAPSVTLEMVQAWVKRDAAAASYFLQMLCKRPEILDEISNELFAQAKQLDKDRELLEKDSL